MNPFSNSFEKKWTFIFLFMYVLIMLPFPWYYATEYIPSFWGNSIVYIWLGSPWFSCNWAIFLWWRSCKNRPEYKEFDDEE